MSTRRPTGPRLAVALAFVVAVVALAVQPLAFQRPVAVAAAQGSYQVVMPYVAVRDRVPLAGSEWVSPFGITMYDELDDANAVDMLAAMRRAGASWVTTTMSWAAVEPTNGGARDWSGYDVQFLNANRAGMDVYVLLLDVPVWARSASRPYAGGAPGMNVASLAQFAAAAAERYDGDGNGDAPGSPIVRYWSLFAEPDYCGDKTSGSCVPFAGEEFKGLWGDSGAQYANMLATVAPAIKAANPNAIVTNGGIAFDYFTDTTYSALAARSGKYVRSFAADVVRSGGAARIGALAIHSFSYPTTTWEARVNALYATASKYYPSDATVRARLEALPLICPEMGYWSSFVRNGSVVTDEPEQARTLVRMYVQGVASGVDRLAWFAVFDAGDPVKDPSEQHGLFWNRNLSQPKQAYWAYQTMASELYGFSYRSALHPSTAGYRAYLFENSATGQAKVVAWATTGTIEVDFAAPQVTVVQLRGVRDPVSSLPITIADGGPGDLDGTANGSVLLQLGISPVYVQIR